MELLDILELMFNTANIVPSFVYNLIIIKKFYRNPKFKIKEH